MVMAAGGTVVVLLILSLLVWMVYVDRKETNRTILEISDIYLAEMADQMAGHFDTTMAGQFTRVGSVMTNITPGDLESQETLSHFIEEKRQKNNFVFLAMLDDKGNFLFGGRLLSRGGAYRKRPGSSGRRRKLYRVQ